MPFARFEINSQEPSNIVLERLRAAVRPKPGVLESVVRGFKRKDPSGPPFVGSVLETSFRIHRDFPGRNSFVPLIWGRIIATHNGTHVRGFMFLHPLVLAFMIFWLGMAAYSAVKDSAAWVMFALGLSLPAGFFFYEVSKAKRLLSAALFVEN